MSNPMTRRKSFAAVAGMAAVGSKLARAAGATDEPASTKRRGSRRALDLEMPKDNVMAYLKMRASVVTQDVYYWFTGRLDVVVPGEPVRPIINVESLILRRTEKLADLSWNVIDWEAALYRHPETGAYLEDGAELLNPATGHMVKPFHYREGPVRFRFTDEEPRIFGSRDVMPRTGKPFHYAWKVVAGDLWMTKSSYIKAPNWLNPVKYPLASSGPNIVVATHSALRAKLADVENPKLASVPTDFSYTATSSWLPWMEMGPTPGHVVWAEAGKKLFSLEEAPAEQVAMLRKVHPQWFARPEPWPEFTNLYLQYAEQHAARP